MIAGDQTDDEKGRRRVIDGAAGNPLRPFTSVANFAFREASKSLHLYSSAASPLKDPYVRPVLESISAFFTTRGLHSSDWNGLPLSDILPVGGGTSRAFHMILQMLSEDVHQENRRREQPIRPAILAPVPTYGLFLEAVKKTGFHIVPVPRDLEAGGRLSRDIMIQCIKNAHEQGLRIVGFFDSNPNNPTGLVRGEQETRELGKVFSALNALYDRQENDSRSGGIPNDLGLIGPPLWRGPASRVCIIDDMAHDGLEYGDEKPFAFAQIEELHKDCFTLFSASKGGLAGLRAGLVISGSEHFYKLKDLQRINEFFACRAGLHALGAYFTLDEPFAARRRRHLERMNADHRFRGLLMKALINGMGMMPEADQADRRRMIAAAVKHRGMTRTEAHTLLERGIPGIRILTTPQSGFFHLIDFSGLKDRYYHGPADAFRRQGAFEVFKDDESVHDLLEERQNLKFLGRSAMGLGKDFQFIGRMTFALPVDDIFEFAARLQRGLMSFAPEQPANTRSPTPVPS